MIVSLHWSADPSCLDAKALAAAVSAKLGDKHRVVVDGPRADIVIDGDLAPNAGEWIATIRTRDHATELGVRDLHEASSNCRAIDDKLVLVIALIIDPDLLTPPPPKQPWRFGASASGLIARGILPGFAFGTAIAARLEPPHAWPIELAATLWPHARATAAPGGADLVEPTGGLAICPDLYGPMSACAGVQAGELRARGFGYSQNQLHHELAFDGTIEVRAEWRFANDFGLRIGVGAWIPFSRPRFVFHTGDMDVAVFQPSAVAGVSEIAVAKRF